MIKSKYYVGLGGGGTKCKATLFNADFKAISRGIDGVEKLGPLVERVFDFTKCMNPSQLIQHYNQLNPSKFAQLAPLVISAAQDDDPIANSIINEAANYLNNIARMSLDISSGNLALVGGVAQAIKPWLSQDIQRVCIKPEKSPEWGAVYYFTTISQGAYQCQI